MSDNIKVVVKVRPLISREIEEKLFYQWRVNNNALIQIDQTGRECGSCFTFEKVYDKDSKTSDVYNDVAKPIVEAATAGFNGTIFAYGQTSSGKTYTMTGTDDSPGIIPLAVQNLFKIIKNIPDRDFLVRVSFVEIYNETLVDLLDTKKNIKIHETFQGVKVGATEKLTTSPEEVLEAMREGQANRQTGSTNMNEESSRSHSIFQITIESREHIEGEEEVGSVNVSQLNLVDLAGSERAGQTGATGLRFKEGTHINKSLSALALVIKQLSEDRNQHVNYRDSKLTRILQNSLGGNAKTSIICAITPAAVEETISTLQFANRAKAIKNTPAVNAVATNATMIQSLTKQLSALKTQLESKKTLEQDNYNLQKQIANLQRLILNGFSLNNTDLVNGSRRKLHQHRRVTISTLHPIQEDTTPPAPRFCTPSLKYNPLSLNTLAEFAPIASSSSLCSVAEEPRLITPPPNEKKVYFSNEIIELDSDDDDTSEDIQTCSPYHKCYQSSNTPPCVLRKNAQQAEKNFKEIVELTEREKIYTPEIVELMEKLENKSSQIYNLEEDINKLNGLSRQKDAEIERLKSIISKAELKIKDISSAKTDLETACKDYNTRLTDWEVSYETLQKKAKRREEELLSLLQETENKKKNERIGQISNSLVHEETDQYISVSKECNNLCNEKSVVNNIESQIVSNLYSNKDLKVQLCLKDETILKLEANLQAQKHKILNLETINNELQDILSVCKEKLLFLDNEHYLHKSTINNLNSTIESQKSIIDAAKSDIESYNSVIKELQIKLEEKDNSSRRLTTSDLNAMLTNEELIIANTENLKNILQSSKAILESRDKEIEKLKLCLGKEQSQHIIKSEEELEDKRKEITLLAKQIDHLKEQAKTNAVDIDNLLLEKKKLLDIEQQLKINLSEVQSSKDILEKQNEEHLFEIEKLKKSNEELLQLIGIEQESHCNNINYEKKIENMSEEISQLKCEIKNKMDTIKALQKDERETQENLNKIKLTIIKVQDVVRLLSGNILEIPELIDNFVTAFNMLTDYLTCLESIANKIVIEKENVLAIVEQREKEINTCKLKLDDLIMSIDMFYKECEDFIVLPLTSESLPSENTVMGTFDNLHNKIKILTNAIITTVSSLKENLKAKDLQLNEMTLDYESKINDQLTKASMHAEEIEVLTRNRDLLLNNISKKVTEISLSIMMDNRISNKLDCNSNGQYELILLTLDKIANHISSLKLKTEEQHNMEKILSEKKSQIQNLTKDNLNLLQDITKLEKSNDSLLNEMKRIQNDSDILNVNLNKSNDILNQLRQDLISKTNEIEGIENKAKEWSQKFKDYELLMTEKIFSIERENNDLKNKCSELEMQNRQRVNNIQSNLASGDQISLSRRRNDQIEFISPPSLLTICCNKIIEFIEPSETEKSDTSSSSTTDVRNSNNICQFQKLSLDVDILKEENDFLKMNVQRLEKINETLLKEHEEVQKEVHLLLENTFELQKKVVYHRTNLATLSATTYAENKSLSSQIKFLQHHHNRFHTVCQKDIPAFKKQLHDLMTLLKSDNAGILNETSKRLSLPNSLDSTSLNLTLKNESILDVLMLDTNVTLTTCDNTLVEQDRTCLDLTQVCAYSEVACQTNLQQITDCNLSHPQIEMQSFDSFKLLETLESLKIENNKLRDLVDEYSKSKKSQKDLMDRQSSPIKTQNFTKNQCTLQQQTSTNNNDNLCSICIRDKNEISVIEDTYKQKIETLSKHLMDTEDEKRKIEEKYHNLSLEVPSTDLLIRKIKTLEKENCANLNEIKKLTDTLRNKNEKLKSLQEENDVLSNEVMESISEVDELKKQHSLMKEINLKLNEKCELLDKENIIFKHNSTIDPICAACPLKQEIIDTLENKLAAELRANLDQSYSDCHNSSRYNKICTLQNELHAGKEDCIELKEEVTTIKNQLERNNLSISQGLELDDGITNTNLYTFEKNYENTNSLGAPCGFRNNQDEPLDPYALEKIDCFGFYSEISGVNKECLSNDVKLIDIMKMLYDNVVIRHANDVEKLNNKLSCLDEKKNDLQTQLNDVKEKNILLTEELKEKDGYLKTMANVVSLIKNNIAILHNSIDCNDSIQNFREIFLKIIDKEFGFRTSATAFDSIINQLNHMHSNEVEKITKDFKYLEDNMQKIHRSLTSANEEISSLKYQLSEKESEFNLLQRQKEKMHEITQAVTLDIIKREEDLRKQFDIFWKKIIDQEIVTTNLDLSLPIQEIVEILFGVILNESNHKDDKLFETKRNDFLTEISNLKTQLAVKGKEICALNNELAEIHEINNKINSNLTEKEKDLKNSFAENDELNQIYNIKIKENELNLKTINTLTEEVSLLKQSLVSKDTLIDTLVSKEKSHFKYETERLQLLKSTENLEKEIKDLKSVNETILKEKNNIAIDLEKAYNVIEQNKADLDRMASDILELNKLIEDNRTIIERQKLELKTVLNENQLLQEKVQEKCKNCSRLETNTKILEKTVENQSKMITRLRKQKEEFDKAICEKEVKLEELYQKCQLLETDCEKITTDLKCAKMELEELRNVKTLLETRLSDLEGELESHKRRLPAEAVSESSRRRRQSLHDSKRMITDNIEDHKHFETSLKHQQKPDDSLMEVDDNSSSRSTPILMNKGRDSLLSKHDQSDEMEEHSRSSSVMAIRRRRQSVHDQHRSVPHTPTENSREFSRSSSSDSEVTMLRKQLSACQQELEELKESYKELDEECETCAQYLRERDETCRKLKKEKQILENCVAELKEKMDSTNLNNEGTSKNRYAHASVNTDEILESMSHRAEVEKYKKLLKAYKELNVKYQELKNNMAKSQKSTDDAFIKDRELESTKAALSGCRCELDELKERYRELDQECETCAEYLRERTEQCTKLKEAKAALENNVAELKEKLKSTNRDNNYGFIKSYSNASVNTDEDWANLHSVVVDRMSFDAEVEKNKKLIKTIEELRFKKQELKMTMVKMQKAMEKTSVKDRELESTKATLSGCRRELDELKERYRELDEECETCAEYLRERTEQCTKLKEAKAALEAKLAEYEDAGSVVQSVRRKRHTLHDQRRAPSPAVADAATETSDDFLSYQPERDNNSKSQTDDTQLSEVKRLKMVLEQTSLQKAALEQQLSVAPLYVATGSAIVQNQQLTNVMKENQKLKKINAKLITICKKRGKSLDSNRENEDPSK